MMMILVGTTTLNLTRATGTFYCPQCAATRTCKHKVRRQFLTVYFIPVFPLQVQGQFLECIQCRHQQAVTEDGAPVQEANRQAEMMEEIRRVLVMIVAADNVVTAEELDTVQIFAARHLGQQVAADAILAEAARAYEHGFDALTFARTVAPRLNEPEKELLVHFAFLAATASGQLSRYRQELLAQLPAALGMSADRFREIVARASQL